MKKPVKKKPSFQSSFRIHLGREVALGPGKAELLRRLRETGSISKAAKGMGMSYMRAWTLVQTMNRCFRGPLVQASRGGKQRGGAALTADGERALALYEEMEERSRKATADLTPDLIALLRPDKGG